MFCRIDSVKPVKLNFLFLLLILLAAMGSAQAAAKVVLVAGGTEEFVDIAATKAALNGPFGIEFDSKAVPYLVELGGHRFLKIEGGLLRKIGGSGKPGNRGDGGPVAEVEFNGLHNLAIASDGSIYLADTWNQKVRKYNPANGTVTTFAGTGEKGYGGDGGPASTAKFGGIYCVTVSPDQKRLLLADLDNRRIRAIDLSTGVVNTIAGNGQKGVPRDGDAATDSPLVDPRAVTADLNGNVYVLERSGHALRIINVDGKIRTVVGTGKGGLDGDGGLGRVAKLNGPKHLCLDRDGNVIIADTENHVIRRYFPQEERIERVAGTGKKGKAGIGGPPEKVELNQPHGVTIGPDGNLYIVDSSNNRVLRIETN